MPAILARSQSRIFAGNYLFSFSARYPLYLLRLPRVVTSYTSGITCYPWDTSLGYIGRLSHPCQILRLDVHFCRQLSGIFVGRYLLFLDGIAGRCDQSSLEMMIRHPCMVQGEIHFGSFPSSCLTLKPSVDFAGTLR
jgi:hypothetical protein